MNKQSLSKKNIQIGTATIKSIFTSAPLAGITDTVQRSLIRKYSPNCLLTTEMISSEALIRRPYGAIIEVSEDEAPVAFQLVGHKPDVMLQAAKIIENRATIIDINMGCPVNKVVKGNDGCSLMMNIPLAESIVKILVDNISKPITIKCRLGINNENKNFIDFVQHMQEAGASAVTLHGRTRSQMYNGQADWDAIAKLKKNIDIPVYANGDIVDVDSAKKCLEITGADGLSIGRGGIGNPFLFRELEYYFSTGKYYPKTTIQEKIKILTEHLNKEIELRGTLNGIKFFRKFYAYYISEIKNASGYRQVLVREENYDNIIKITREILLNSENEERK